MRRGRKAWGPGGVLLALALWLAPATACATPAPAAPEARVRAALVEAIAQRGPWEAGRIVVSDLALPRGLALPAGTAIQVTLPGRERLLGRIPFRVTVSRDGGQETVWASARVEVMVPALVATRNIGRHQVLDPALLQVTDVPLSRLPGGAVTRPEALLGQRSVRRIARGRPVTRGMVEARPVVLRGDRITLLVRRPGLTVTAIGEAREDGAPAGVIQVLNLRSHRTVQGRVINATTVEVEY